MSSYGSYPSYGGGRNGSSPYTSNIVDPYAGNLSGHFEYIDADHGILKDSHRNSVPNSHAGQDDPNAPDVILVRYMASLIPVEFPAYSVSEEKAFVGQLREAVARALQTDSRRIRLVYKKHDLKHDSWPLRKYHMKQNSEVAAIKTESVVDYSDRDSHSSSGEESSATSQNPRRRPRALSSVRHRSEDQFTPQKTSTSSGFLAPTGHVSSGRAPERLSHNSLKPEADERDYRRESSRTRGTSPRPAPATTSARPSRVAADPNTPLGKLQTLSDTFHENWLPLCRRFISNPPSDVQDRVKEHRKLSESVMTHVLLKADAIDVNNSEERAFRKSLINQANDVVRQLDAVAKA
ncbi:hypothetical protein PV11_08631 [Exophiala sideris]|uniref:BAG domain-containing protein n=1 Tax=Exophiala sideris TaxID=1016849 RepID=A0A0D1VXW7_9EURO|nr:hypothetical protein PV11_08631 [Exophiala sideris]